MKLSLALSFLLASTASAVSSSKTVVEKDGIRAKNGPALRKLVANSRRMEEEANNQAEEEMYDFLQYYHIKFVKCLAGEKIANAEGEYEYNAVAYRLCPAESCDSDSASGCSDGYGDMVVGLDSFVDAYFEMNRENQQDRTENEFNLEEYRECRQWEMQQQEDGGRKLNEEAVFYVGPACTSDGNDIKLEWFSDENCQYPEETYTYESVTGDEYGLPYGDGGIISKSCISCYEMGDNSEYGVADFCMNLYEDSKKCESKMEAVGYYGKDESSCEYIEELMPSKSGMSGAGKVIFWIILIALVVGVGYWFFMQQKKKKAARAGVDNSGLMT
jgi:hypothetical protein